MKDQAGFTLPEVLVTMVMMLTVMFALYAIFDMSLRVFSFGNDKTEAVQNARLGMERMEREIRAAYPYDKADEPSEDHLFWSSDTPSTPTFPSSDQITFGNDLNGNRKIDGDELSEEISYRLSSGGSPYTLLRNGEPVSEFVASDGLELAYMDGDGDLCKSSNPDCTGTDESEIEVVRITLEVKVDRGPQAGTQTLSTDVALRNRSGQ